MATRTAYEAGRRFAGATRRRRPGRAARQHALRYPDMYTEGGEVHPIRNSPGYDPLEDRAHGLERERTRERERQQEDYEAGERLAHAQRDYRELQQAIRRNGGLRPTRDYPAEDIPADVRPARGDRGTSPDEMPLKLRSEGFRYSSAEDLLEDLRKRRAALHRLGRQPDTRGRLRAGTRF